MYCLADLDHVEALSTGTSPGFIYARDAHPNAAQLARKLAQLTGENVTTATKRAIEERLRRVGGQSRRAALLEDMVQIRRRWNAMPIVDDRTPEEILGYDKHGLPR